MSKILVLSGSPRKDGNTDKLVEAFAKGAAERSKVEIMRVCDMNINPCKGCNYCFKSEENTCVQNDDMSVIYKKLAESDVLVIASPLYFYGVSAQLKAVIDRLHTPARNRFGIKKLALICVGAAKLPEMFDSLISQYELVLKFFKFEDAGRLLISGAKEKGAVSADELERAYLLGKSINKNG